MRTPKLKSGTRLVRFMRWYHADARGSLDSLQEECVATLTIKFLDGVARYSWNRPLFVSRRQSRVLRYVFVSRIKKQCYSLLLRNQIPDTRTGSTSVQYFDGHCTLHIVVALHCMTYREKTFDRAGDCRKGDVTRTLFLESSDPKNDQKPCVAWDAEPEVPHPAFRTPTSLRSESATPSVSGL